MTHHLAPELALDVEELEALDALEWDWGHFFVGVGVGLTMVSIGVGVAIT